MALSNLVPVYARSQRKTRLCMRRKKWRYGAPYVYKPRQDLVKRCMQELGMSEAQVMKQISKEVTFLRANPWFPLDLKPGD